MAQKPEDLGLKLGRQTTESSLDPIPRSMGREGREELDFYGYDLWNAYEVSFLLPSGKPTAYVMQASYDAASPNMVESKSFKLFLNAQNNRVFENADAFERFVKTQLEACIGAPVHLTFLAPDISLAPLKLPGRRLDDLEPTTIAEHYDAGLLESFEADRLFLFHSHLLRSNCPVTNQPDWGAVMIMGKGPRQPKPEALLAYLLSYRNHQGFHETCCEQIFFDLRDALEPERLEVGCFYTRRGGLDINPFRTTESEFTMYPRPVWRQ
ncbi:MAG: NADPH-dependent 7-cyano-7-deazaguanine reductase QueF [Acidobacteriota bacterium]|nr:NADPH-dependent 7-cyano-7-deazaguanine reductase QueF [Acidobacteriota bacterium]